MNRLFIFSTYFCLLSCHSNIDKAENAVLTSADIPITDDVVLENRFDTLLNTNEYLVLGNKSAEIKIIKQNDLNDLDTSKILISYRDDILIGENIDDDNIIIYRKYLPKTSFEDYPTEIYEGKLADPNFSTNKGAKRFITRIKNECEKGVNFAGHYTLVIWGCGSPCQSGVLVDRKSGKIFGGYGTTFGSKFRKNSSMIIRNVGAIDTTTNLIKLYAYSEVNHEIWTGTEFKEIE